MSVLNTLYLIAIVIDRDIIITNRKHNSIIIITMSAGYKGIVKQYRTFVKYCISIS